jgi:spartin
MYIYPQNIIRRHTDRGNSFPGTPASSGTTTPDLLPSDFKNQLVLVDEATGKVLGPLSQDVPIAGGQSISTSNDKPGQTTSDEAVVVSFYGDQEGDQSGQPVRVSPFDDLTRDFGKSNSKILGAAEYVSKGILFAAEYGANTVSGAANNYVKTTKATDSPLVFSDTTKANAAKVASATESAAKFSRKTLGFIGNKVEQFGGAAVRYGSKELENLGLVENDPAKKKASDPNSGIGGLFKNTVRAALLVAEGVEKGGKHFLETSRTSTNTFVEHKYGEQARDLTDSITSAGSNVVLVYVDARGIMHRALLKRVGKGAIRAKMQDGRQVVLDDAGFENQHTERDEKGNLIVVDDETNKETNLGGGSGNAGYSTALETTSGGNQSALLQRQPPAKPDAPPIPPRD